MSDQLNPRQLEAVYYIDGPLLVLAGAGSGKTRVITQKIAYLIKECGMQAKHIAAVTFTNKASREMKARVSGLLGGKEGRGLKVSTFHTLGLSIIRSELKTLGLKTGFSIFDNHDSIALLKELMKREFDGDDAVDQVLWQISRWKSGLVLPDAAMHEATEKAEPFLITAAVLYETYQRHLRAYNAVDFDDLIMVPVTLFRTSPEVLTRWQNRIQYLLVDEYQDTNGSQYELVRLLVGSRCALTVVGDDDQSIYAWRGAQPENMALLQTDFPGLKVVKLEQNYRSMGCILKAANQVISNNPHVFDKRLWSERGYGDPIKVLVTKDEANEADKVVAALLHHKFTNRTRFDDYAILYRGNFQSRVFEKVLRENRIPYQLSGGTSFFAQAEVKDIMAYLRLMVNQDDDNAFLRIANTPRRELGPTTIEKLAGYANQRGNSLFAASFELGLEHHLSEKGVAKLRRFTEWLVDVADKLERGDALGVIKDMILAIDYHTWLMDTCKDVRTAERRMENVWELVEWLERLMDGDGEGQNKTLSEAISHITLIDILERNEEDNSGPEAVRMMTLHASKGLEFPHVFLVGMEEELLPHRVSIEEGNLEEERRLAYVGITRAQRTLTLSYAVARTKAGERVECQPSRFIAELPEDDLQWEGGQHKVPTEVRQERGQAHLANLRSLLSEDK